ncbi:NTP transferase domain-containing protein [Coprothermobacteraceae bacterium]|nr:NTP transferase domain-containing protein [Coprothermobacteraceae bacterium]
MNGLILVAGGRGERFSKGRGKAELRVFKGRSLLEYWSVKLHELKPLFDQIVVVSWQEIPGFGHADPGATRKDSVANGFSALRRVDKVLVHDAARPLASIHLFERVLAWLDTADVVVPTTGVEDALRIVEENGSNPFPRFGLLRVQTPQGFKYEVLKSVLESELSDVDEASVAQRLGWNVTTIEGERQNLKITYPEDVFLQQLMYSEKYGFGVDFHRYSLDKPLVLGGVTIEDAGVGLESWTDGDVVLHAVSEAILSLFSGGDLGTLFPNSEEWRGARSETIVSQVLDMARSRGVVVEELKITLVADRPLLRPWIERIRTSVARITNANVFLSVTRSEGVFVGGLDGMICVAFVKGMEVKT